MDIETRKKRIRYRSWHRGCKETDLILGHFCDQFVPQMNPAALDEFEAILDEEDDDLYRWLTGKTPLPPHMANNQTMHALLDFDVSQHWETRV